ncbi:MAG: hypothetical protein LBN05_08995 [Oscillospiraceae bacterium]|jgi:hypothetical protein|nr:hypothetical protein [Oscillospiraceae bacterium]
MADGFRIVLRSAALQKQLAEALRRNPRETTRAVTDCVLHLAGESAVLAPVESGDLRSDCKAVVNGTLLYDGLPKSEDPTGKAHGNGYTGASPTPTVSPLGKVSYSLPYTIPQHEDLTLRHDRADGYVRADGSSVNRVPGGQAKYLQQPFEQNEARYIQRFARIPSEVIQ